MELCSRICSAWQCPRGCATSNFRKMFNVGHLFRLNRHISK